MNAGQWDVNSAPLTELQTTPPTSSYDAILDVQGPSLWWLMSSLVLLFFYFTFLASNCRSDGGLKLQKFS